LERMEQNLTRRRETCKRALIELHEVLDQAQWRKVVDVADQVLAVAPQNAQARKARSQAWKAIEPPTVAPAPLALDATRPGNKAEPRRNRFMLWFDGVGGFLVCLDPRIRIGQAPAEATADVGLFADVSRVHATVQR